MTFPSLAIIGTAGRKEDQDRLTKDHYDRMVRAVVKLILHLEIDPQVVKLVSGGAAWSDHIAVTLVQMGGVPAKNLTLYLPTAINDQGYFGETDLARKTANTANYYHRLFSNKTGYNTIRDILEVEKKGAILIPGNGSFHARNADVAKFVSSDGALIAFTFGKPGISQAPWTMTRFSASIVADDAGLKDGGTAHTWNVSRCTKFHALIGYAYRESYRADEMLSI